MNLPRTAYILLWFPKPSETFVFWEILGLRKMGVPLKVFTLYGKLNSGLSNEMQRVSSRAERLGLSFLPRAFKDILYWFKRDRALTRKVLRTSLFRRWRGIEKTGESFWAVFCAFHLARRFSQNNIHHIHAPWAGGPATAAWVASRLTGIPFSFSARAWDIRPPDGALPAKTRDAAFVRCESRHNLNYMAGFTGGDAAKIHVVYNPITLQDVGKAPVRMKAPYKLLAVGRLVKKKGFEHLISACKTLKDSGLDFHLKIAGDGPLNRQLQRLTHKLDLGNRITFLGHVPHDRISGLMCAADVFLMPSQVAPSGDSDGLPTVISEALLHILPVVATDVAGISDLIEDETTGLLVPQKDPSAIARAVGRMVGDRTWALEMAERGRLKALYMYDSEKNNRMLLELIRNHATKPEGTRS